MIKADRTYVNILVVGIIATIGFTMSIVYSLIRYGFTFGTVFGSFTVMFMAFTVWLMSWLSQAIENARQGIFRGVHPMKQLLPVLKEIADEDEPEGQGETPDDVLGHLSLPWELRWRPGIALLSTPFVPGILAVLCYGNILRTLLGWIASPSPEEWKGTIIFAIMASVLFWVAELLIVWFTRKRMVITQDGIARIKFGRTRIISWQEARLFLKISYGMQTYYELSSATTIIRWQGGWEGIVKANFIDDDIANINDLVVACTGLPLVEPAPK